ncbi:MAG: M23 family metallopeptidase [Dethiobacteria bacterium]|nr:M23 family metallopeptidase [Dethiobacteria bacterium]
MKRKQFQSFIFLVIAFFFVSTALFFFQDAEVTTGPSNKPINMIIPYLATEPGLALESKIVLYPETPAPGDFLIVEAGPFPENEAVKIEFEFPGIISNDYRAGKMLYTIIAISPDLEPGTYQLRITGSSITAGDKNLQKPVVIAAKEFHTSYFTMPAERTEGWTAARLAEDREKIRLARDTTEPHPLWLKTFVNPLEGRISSLYGAIRFINNNPPRRHSGIDIVADEGTPVITTNNGIVRLAEDLLSGGNTVIIDHGIGLSSTYMHLQRMTVTEGQTIERGDLIGTVGMTGYATGPHLHWEVNIKQTSINPEQLLQNDLLWIAPAYVEDWISAME